MVNAHEDPTQGRWLLAGAAVFGDVVGPLGIAALVDFTGGFTIPFYLIGVLALASMLLPAKTAKPAERAAPAVAATA